MALGVDVEKFVSTPAGIIPAKAAMSKSSGMQPIFKEIGSDIAPKGYNSFLLKTEHSAVTEDGLAIECPCTPSIDVPELISFLAEGVRAAQKVAEDNGGCLIAAPVVHFDMDWVKKSPELRVLGCSPDVSLYAEGECKPHQDPRNTSWRTGGGHIHFSTSNIDDVSAQQQLVALCDLVLGTADVLLAHNDLAKQRREMYGQPGKYRRQPWGIEYRTMSNVWVTTPELARTVFALAKGIHQVIESGVEVWDLFDDVGMTKLMSTITECNVDQAYEIFDQSFSWMWSQLPGNADLSGAANHVIEIARQGGVQDYTVRGW